MEPKFQSSFIPKRPVVDSPRMLGPVKKNRNIFSVLASLMFLVAMFAVGGVFVYGKMVDRNIKDADAQLAEVRSAFEADRVQELFDASARLSSVKNLLENHYVVSEVLVMLQNLTLKTMRFDNLNYKNNGQKSTINLDAEAQSYNSIANQKEGFMGSGVLSESNFSDYMLTDRGLVKAKFFAVVSPRLVSYKEFINSRSVEQ